MGIKNEKITAVIVLYCPELLLLERLLKSVSDQVGHIVVIDNSPSDPSANLKGLINDRSTDFYYQWLGENRGIATAQNIGIKKASEDGCSHVLLLDQDSSLPSEAVGELLAAEESLLSAGDNVAVVGPAFIHERTKKVEKGLRHVFFWTKGIPIDLESRLPVEVDCLISSGSLIRTSVFDSVGVMRDDLFIDLVDIEWGLRAKYSGWKSYVIPTVTMIHNLGKTAVKVQDKWFYFHNDLRHYYIVRNTAYLFRLRTMGIKWRSSAPLKIARNFVVYTLFSDHKLKTFWLLFRALVDGVCGKLGRFDKA